MASRSTSTSRRCRPRRRGRRRRRPGRGRARSATRADGGRVARPHRDRADGFAGFRPERAAVPELESNGRVTEERPDQWRDGISRRGHRGALIGHRPVEMSRSASSHRILRSNRPAATFPQVGEAPVAARRPGRARPRTDTSSVSMCTSTNNGDRNRSRPFASANIKRRWWIERWSPEHGQRGVGERAPDRAAWATPTPGDRGGEVEVEPRHRATVLEHDVLGAALVLTPDPAPSSHTALTTTHDGSLTSTHVGGTHNKPMLRRTASDMDRPGTAAPGTSPAM